MAFQMSTLACRIKIPISFGVLTHSRGINSGKVFGPILNLNLNCNDTVASRVSKSLLNSSDRKQTLSVFTRRLNVCDPTLHFGVTESGRIAKFSTTSVSFQTGIGWAPSRKKAQSIRQGCCVLLGALGLSTVVASLHSTSLRAMATGSDSINLDSAKTDWKEAKKVLLSASLEERRALYRTSDFLALEQIPIWAPSGQPTGNTLHPPNEALNPKISLFRGDITKLEIDGIVNAANKTLLGGGGDVIHTVGPITQGTVGEQERDGLRSCYRACLDVAVENRLRTVAFPCISTGVYGYPPDEAVDVALATVRQYLEEHHAQLDRVIFCVFLKSDEELYQERLPQYFPRAG